VLEEFSYSRMSTVELKANMLSTWIENRNQCYVPEIKLLVQIKTHSVYEDLLQDSDNTKLFNISSGWFCNFMKICNFYNIRMRGEAAFSDTVTMEVFVKELQHGIKKGIYSPKQILNIAEIAVFWQRMHSRTYISQDNKSAPRFEAMRDKFTLLLSDNA